MYICISVHISKHSTVKHLRSCWSKHKLVCISSTGWISYGAVAHMYADVIHLWCTCLRSSMQPGEIRLSNVRWNPLSKVDTPFSLWTNIHVSVGFMTMIDVRGPCCKKASMIDSEAMSMQQGRHIYAPSFFENSVTWLHWRYETKKERKTHHNLHNYMVCGSHTKHTTFPCSYKSQWAKKIIKSTIQFCIDT